MNFLLFQNGFRLRFLFKKKSCSQAAEKHISWRLLEVTNRSALEKPLHRLVLMCRDAEDELRQPNRLPNNSFGRRFQMSYTVEGLMPGVEYGARVSLCKSFQGTLYRSKETELSFTTEPPSGTLAEKCELDLNS